MSRKEDIKNIIVIVRALVSSAKPPVSLQCIESDFYQVENMPIPYKQLGYQSLLDMLEDSNEFNIQKIGNDIKLSNKLHGKSAHIASMVRSQKPSKSKAIVAPSCPHPLRSRGNFRRPNNSSNNYAYQTYQQAQTQRVFQQPKQTQEDLLTQELNRIRAQFNQDILHLRRQQEEQQRQESLLKASQLQILEEQRKYKLELHKQKEAVIKKISQLQAEHKEDLTKQAQTIQQLQNDREELQRKLELQELSQKQLETTQANAKEQQEMLREVQQKLTEISIKHDKSEKTSHSSSEMNQDSAFADTVRKVHLRPILGNSASIRPGGKKQSPTTDMSAGTFTVNKRSPHPRVNYPGSRPGGNVSVNYRLKQQQTPKVTSSTPTLPPQVATQGTAGALMTPPDSPENGVSIKTTGLTQHYQPLMPSSRLNLNFKFDAAYDAVSSLKQYCVALRYAPPEYEFYNAVKSNNLHCKVRIGESIFTSYPKEHPDEASAKQFTAEVAVERLKVLESRKHFALLSDDEFLNGLFEELIKHPNGIVSHKLPEWYESVVKRQVPNNWWPLISNSPKIRIESSVNTNIVFANEATEGKVTNSPQHQAQKMTTTDIPELQLPWVDGQQDWSMYITHCENTLHIWARLIDQGTPFEKLTEKLNKYMSQPQNRLPLHQNQEPIMQRIYLVEVSETWNRVRIISLNSEKRQCVCHFVDFGDESVLNYDTIYLCSPQFLSLPAQAVCLSMYALDKFEDHPHALPVLNKELAGHSVVTRIITTEAQFKGAGGRTQGVVLQQNEPTDENGCGDNLITRRACIVGTFYDTSTTEDIHLNDLVANMIIRNTPAPVLKPEQKSNHVIVSHVSDVGDLMVQLPNDDLKFVQRNIAKNMNESSEQHRVDYADLLRDQLVCVCDESGDGGKNWYRGMLTTKPKSPEEEVFDVYYVDDGRLRKTHISNIYRLEANNLALASFPAQALRVRLHDVPPIDNQMVLRLRELLSPQTPVLLKVMEGTNDKLPMVTIHARGRDSLYLCLNSAIRMEYEMQSTTRLEPFDDGGLHFSPNGQLIRRTSFSSIVASQSSCKDQPTAVGIVTPPNTPQKGLLPLLKEYEAIPAVGTYFEVRVALSINPGHFAVQPYKCYNQLQRLMKELQAHCNSTSVQKVSPIQLTIGQAYAVIDSDNIYQRAIIRKIFDEIIHVRFVDAGDDGVVRCNQLRQLPVEFRELPMMALPAQLYGVQLTEIDWTKENCVRFRKLTLGLTFIAIVHRVDKLKDYRRALCLELIDTSTPQDIKVHETLIAEKHAVAAL